VEQADRAPDSGECAQCGLSAHKYFQCNQELTTKAALNANISYLQRQLEMRSRTIKKLRGEKSGDKE